MKKQVGVIGILVGILLIGIAIFFGAAWVMYSGMQTQGIWSIVLLVIFSIVLYKVRSTKDPTATTVIAFFAAFMGMAMDTWGNFIYNKPLEWIYSSQGQLVIGKDISNYAPGHYASSYSINLITKGGEIEPVSSFILYGYRFIQYLILFLIIGYAMRWLLKDKNVVPYKVTEVRSEILTVTQKKEVIQLLKENNKVKAVKVVMDNSKVSMKTAKDYVDWLEKENVDRSHRTGRPL